jgi:TP901 family phage tail tape measure protein
MAGFNLTAQINLVGPTNVKQIAAQIRKDLGNVNATVKFKLDPSAAKNVASLNSSLKNLNKTLGATNTLAQNASTALSGLARSASSVKLGNIPRQINQINQATTKLSKNSKNISDGFSGATSEIREFGKQAALAVRRFTAFTTVTGVIYGLTNSINQGIKAYIEYDRELIRLQQVTNKTASGLRDLQNEITRLSTSLGVSSKDLTTVSVTLAQAGLSARDTEKALQALARSSLAPTFDDLNDTVEGSIALMRQFGISAAELEGALGSVNSVAAAFAVEAGDIIAAIQRTGGVFATASKGVSEGTDALNEFIAVFTSVRATTRESAETIATGLRTIFTRIQRGDTIDALKQFGVNLTDAEGKFVGAYKAVELLSNGLSKLDPRDLKFSEIVEELGGFRQIGKVIPLIQQFATAQEALAVAQQGQGSLAKDAATAQLSLSNQITKVREEFLALFRSIGQSQGFQTIVRGALMLTSALIKVADAAKTLLPALAVITAFKGAKGLTEFAKGFMGGIKKGPDNKSSDDARLFASGGKVRYFARGGVVPGSGNRDTVPAMLQPGEFVIRKKAAETIGADRLHKMNKYASGGEVYKSPKKYGMLIAEEGNPDDHDEWSWEDKKNKKTYKAGIRVSGFSRAGEFKEKTEVLYNTIDDLSKDLGKSIGVTELNPKGTSIAKGIMSTVKGKMFENYVLTAAGLPDPGNAPFDIKTPTKTLQDYTDESVTGLTDIKLSDNKKQRSSIIKKAVAEDIGSFKKVSQKKSLGGYIQKFFDGGWVKRMQKVPKSQLAVDVENLEYWIDKIEKNAGTTGWSRTYKGTQTEEVDLKELLARKNAILEVAQAVSAKKAKSGLKGAEGYEPEELLDAVKLYQGGSGPLTRAMANNDLLFIDRDEQYDTEDVVNRLKASSQYSAGRKKLYSGIGRGQFYEILKDVGVDQKDYDQNGINDKTVQQMVGKIIDFPTFVSTSYDKSVAEAFIGRPGGLMDISTAKSQTKGIDIDKAKATKDPGKRREGRELPGLSKIKQSKLLKYDDEKEFVLPPNTQFKIKKAVNQQTITTNDKGEQFILEDSDYFGGDRVVDLSVQMLGEGGMAGSLTGIYDSDKIQGGTKVKKALLDQLKASGKAYGVIHGAAGSGKTTLASQRYGENFVLSPEDLAKYERFIVLSGAAATKSGEFSEDVKSLMGGASGITALMPGEERLSAQRQKRVDEAILGNIQDTRSVSQLQGTLKAPANVSRSLFEKFKGVNYLEEYAVGGEVERLAAKFNLGQASQGWWKGKFRDQDILWDMANRKTAYNAEDGSAIDISSLPVSLKKTWDYKAQTELDEYRKYRSMVRGAAQTPRTIAEEEYGKVAESSIMSATQRIADKKKQQEVEKIAARGGRFTGDYEPTRARQQSKIDRMTPDERKQYYARKFNGYMAGSTVTDEQPSAYLDQLIKDIAELGGPKEVRRLAKIPDGDPRARKALNANAIKANKDTAYAESLITKAKKKSEAEAEQRANDISLANKFALVGVYPLGYNKSFGPLDIGGKSTFYSATALGTEYQPEIDAMRKVADEAPSNAMKSIQMKKIFSSKPLALDLDDTLITGADIYKPGSAGDPDIPAYSDVGRVTEALKNARLTQLGQELKTRLNDDPSLLDDIRILTARPQNNADPISQRLQQLGLAISADKITGVSGASNKVDNVTDLETLVDDRLETISAVLQRGKRGIGYSEISGYDPNRVASKRNAEMIEAYIAEEMLTRIGIDLPADAESNRSIDFPNGLGAAASFWGIDPFVPTDIKRTMDGSAFDRFREEIERFYTENAERYARGGSAEDTVPALLTPGEFVINRKAAQQIGYSQLNKLNNADKIQGFNKGGAVGVVQKFAAGGMPDFSKWIGTLNDIMSFAAPKKLPQNPTTEPSIEKMGFDPAFVSDVKTFVSELNKAGYGMKNLAYLINQNRQLSIAEIEQAASKDLDRLKQSTASIEQITTAEGALAAIRNAGIRDYNKLLDIQETLQLRNAKNPKVLQSLNVSDIKNTTGAMLQAIRSQAEQLIQSGGDPNQAYLKATSRITGQQTSDLEDLGITNDDIQQYIAKSMKDRKVLSEMDDQLIVVRKAELQSTTEFKNATFAVQKQMLADLKTTTEEEISERRRIINELAAQSGESGPGAGGLLDFNNSPILNQLKERYIAKNDEAGFGFGGAKLNAKAFTDMAVAIGLVAGQARNLYDTFRGINESSPDADRIESARIGGGLESAGTMLSTGFAAAGQALAIPIVGPYIAGITALGTAALTASDMLYDWSGSQEAAATEMEKAIGSKRLMRASDKLSDAFDKLNIDTTNLSNVMNATAAIREYTDASLNQANRDARSTREEAETRTWGQFFMFQGADVNKGSMGQPEWKEFARAQSGAFDVVANQGYRDLERLLRSGFSLEDIRNPADADQEQAGLVNSALRAMVLADRDIAATYFKMISSDDPRTKQEADTYLQNQQATFLENNAKAQAIVKTIELERAMEDVNRKGRQLAESFDKLTSAINQSISRIQFEAKQRASFTKAMLGGIRGQMDVPEYVDRNVDILSNPSAYSQEDFDKALDSAVNLISDPEKANMLRSGAIIETRLGPELDAAIRSIVSGEGRPEGNANLPVDEAATEAKKQSAERIDDLPITDELKKFLKQQANVTIDTAKQKAEKSKEDDKLRVFTEEVNSGMKGLANRSREAAKELLQLRQAALNVFNEGLKQSTDALLKEAEYRRKAANLRRSGDINLREALFGYGESFEEASANLMGEVAALSGGLTDPRDISAKLEKLTDPARLATEQQKLKDGLDSDDEATRNKAAADFQKYNMEVSNTRAALDKLADSAALAEKALAELKNLRGLQEARLAFADKLLTNTPEEADNLNQAFIRLQRNLSGGLNFAGNQRDARKAFNETLFQTGSVRQAARAGQTTLANQRKETLQLLNDPGFRAGQELSLRNRLTSQRVTGTQQDKIVNDTMRAQDIQVRRQMAIESGMINNPLVQQSLRALEDPTADESIQKAANNYLQSIGLAATATEEQARLEAINSTRALNQANIDLKASMDGLNTTMTQALNSLQASITSLDGTMQLALNNTNRSDTKETSAGTAVNIVPSNINKGGLIRANRGGQIRANTTGGVDNIDAKLTDKEFVVNAKAAEENLDLLHSINSGRKPIYANRGLLVEDRFANLDLNSDSFLTKDELPKFFPIKLFDKDKNNKIDRNEFESSSKPENMPQLYDFDDISVLGAVLGYKDQKPELTKAKHNTAMRALKKTHRKYEPLYEYDRKTYGEDAQAATPAENDINSKQRTEAAGRKADESAKTIPEAESSASRKKTDETLRMLKEDADWLRKNKEVPKPQEEPKKPKPLGETIKEYNDDLAKTQRRSVKDLSTDPTNRPQSPEDLILYREGLSRGLTIEQIKQEKALLEEAKKSLPINPRTGQPFKSDNEYNAYKRAVLGNTPDPGEDRTLDQEFRRNLILPTMAPNDSYTPKTSGEQARDSINKSRDRRQVIRDKAKADLDRQIDEDYRLYEEEMATLSPEGREYVKNNAEKLSRGLYYDSKMPRDVEKLYDNIRNRSGTMGDRVPGSRTGEGNFWRFVTGASKKDLVNENAQSSIAQAEISDELSNLDKAQDYENRGMFGSAAIMRQRNAAYSLNLGAQKAAEKESLRMEGASREQEIKDFQNKALEIRVNPNDSSDIYHPQVVESADGKSLSLRDPRTGDILATRTVPQDYVRDKEVEGEFLIRRGSTFSELNSIRAAQAQDQTLKQAKDIIRSEENKDIRAIKIQDNLNRNIADGKKPPFKASGSSLDDLNFSRQVPFDNLPQSLKDEYTTLSEQSGLDPRKLYEQEAAESAPRVADIRSRIKADENAAMAAGTSTDAAMDMQRSYLRDFEISEEAKNRYEERQRKKEAERVPTLDEIQTQKTELRNKQQQTLNELEKQRKAMSDIPTHVLKEGSADSYELNPDYRAVQEIDRQIEEEKAKLSSIGTSDEMKTLNGLEQQREAIDAQNTRLEAAVQQSKDNQKQKDIILAHYEQAIAQAQDDRAKAENQRKYDQIKSDLRTSRLGYNPDKQKQYPTDTQRWNDNQYKDAADYIQSQNQNAPTYDWLARKVPAEPGMTRAQAEQAAEVAENQKQRREPAAGYYKGGMVYANNGQLIDFKPKGLDTIPAMLAEGEYVINAESTAKNLPLLKAINNDTPLDHILPKYAHKGGLIYRNQGSQKPEDDTWFGSSNPFISGLGYLGGVAQGVGDAVYGGANIAAGAIATAAAPVTGAIGYALSDAGAIRDSQGNIKQGVQLQSPSENTQRLRTAGNTEMQSDYAAATGAAAQVGIDAMVAGATSGLELGQAIIGQGPLMTGEQTALQRNDEKNIELAGGRDSMLGTVTGISQNIGYAASQGAAALVNAEGLALNVAGGALRMVPGGARALGAAGKAGSAISGGIGRAAGAVGDVLGNRGLFPGLNAVGDNVAAMGRGLYDDLAAPFGSAMREAGEFIGLDGVSWFNRSARQSTSRAGRRATQAPTRKYASAEEWAAARRQQQALDADMARRNSRTSTSYDIYADDTGQPFTPPKSQQTPSTTSVAPNKSQQIMDPMQAQAQDAIARDAAETQRRLQKAASPKPVTKTLTRAELQQLNQSVDLQLADIERKSRRGLQRDARFIGTGTIKGGSSTIYDGNTGAQLAARKAAQEASDQRASRALTTQRYYATSEAPIIKSQPGKIDDISLLDKAKRQAKTSPATTKSGVRNRNLVAQPAPAKQRPAAAQTKATAQAEQRAVAPARSAAQVQQQAVAPARSTTTPKKLPAITTTRPGRPNINSPDFVDFYSKPYAGTPQEAIAKKLLAHRQLVYSRLNDSQNYVVQRKAADDAWKAFIKSNLVSQPAQTFRKGGLIYANNGKYVNFEPKGEDTIPAMLTRGEYVVNADSTSKHLGLLKAINEDKPLDAIMPMYANDGGYAWSDEKYKTRDPLDGRSPATNTSDYLKEFNIQNLNTKARKVSRYDPLTLGVMLQAHREGGTRAQDDYIKSKQAFEQRMAEKSMVLPDLPEYKEKNLGGVGKAPPVSMPGSEGITTGGDIQPATMPALRSLGKVSGIQPVPMPGSDRFRGSPTQPVPMPMPGTENGYRREEESIGGRSVVPMSKPSGFAQNNQLNMGDIANSIYNNMSANSQPIRNIAPTKQAFSSRPEIIQKAVSATNDITNSKQTPSVSRGQGGVLDTEELRTIFDQFVKNGIGQLQTSISTFGDSIGTFAESSSSMTNGLVKTSASFGAVSEQLSSISIPDTVNFTGTVQSEHRINGAEAANRVLDTLGPTMKEQTNQLVNNAFNNVNRGVGRLDAGAFGPDTNQIMGGNRA